jgi:hypothetical protein
VSEHWSRVKPISDCMRNFSVSGTLGVDEVGSIHELNALLYAHWCITATRSRRRSFGSPLLDSIQEE